MKMIFKTNIHCSSCVRAVSAALNAEKGISSWTVDTDTSDKLLTVETSLSAEQVVRTVESAGFDAAPLSKV